MNLLDLVSFETGERSEAIMFLRHANRSVAKLRQFGVTIEEYTCVQPTGTKYDYFNPKKARISVIVVVVEDRVYGVYRVAGIEAEGPSYTIASEEHTKFNEERGKAERLCRRFALVPIPSISVDLPVRGWEAGIASVQRLGNKFFRQIELGSTSLVSREVVEQSFHDQVRESLLDTSEFRLKRLAQARRLPRRVPATTFVFERNPDVVAESLFRAKGVCQACGSPAPFVRRADKTPYLEVHHKKPLAKGGEDTVENATALCPNCHRKEHYA